ncbi:MAG TPA: hypothetical protein VG367_07850 [Mucilaginibacter sp.]|jgi:hypothetical protein|nr:hypothetical protein [Mucilaginibacter sp.]
MEIALTIIGIVFTGILSYYLAFKQGIFKKATLFFQPVFPTKYESYKKNPYGPWFIVNSCHLSSSDDNRLIIFMPLTIENKGLLAAENVTVTFFYDAKYTTEHQGDDFLYKEAAQMNSGAKRFHNTMYEFCQSVYEFPMIAPQGKIGFFEPINFDPRFLKLSSPKFNQTLFNGLDKKIDVTNINYQISAKNLERPITGNFWAIFCSNASMDDFLNGNEDVICRILETYNKKYKKITSKKLFLPMPRKFWFNLFYKNLKVVFNIDFKEICAYSFMETKEKKLFAIEAIEKSKAAGATIVIPFVCPQ